MAYIQHAMTLQFSLYEFIKIPRNFRLFRYIHEHILEKGIYKTKQIEKKTTTTISKQNTNECVCVEKWMEIDNYVML